MKTIKSVLHPEQRAYELLDDWSELWQRRGNAHLLSNLAQFDTYGDGMTKHSPSWCSQWSDLQDACLSLSAAIVAEPEAPEYKRLTFTIHRHSADAIRFALSIVYKDDGKTRYFNLADRKLTTADKRNDRRFERVESWMDGTCKSAMSILLNGLSLDWLEKAVLAVQVRSIFAETTGGYEFWGRVFKPLADLAGLTHPEDTNHNLLPIIQSVESYIAAVQAVEYLDNAKRQAECALTNLRRVNTPAEVAA